jgi:ribosome-binding ATPase YchF (GTP1/OBG family)
MKTSQYWLALVPRAWPADLPHGRPEGDPGWEIRAGATAPEAAGVIHTDFQRGFIKAEVVSFGDLLAAGAVPAARSAGKARIEGKDYVMHDGDVVEFRLTCSRHPF